MTATVMMLPIKAPIIGERKIKSTVLPIPSHCNTPSPDLPMAEPIKLKVSAWEELVGRPRYHVKRFQRQAEINVARITPLSTMVGSTRPLPMVPATFRSKTMKAMKLKKAAHTTACCGLRTLVDTTVAME